MKLQVLGFLSAVLSSYAEYPNAINNFCNRYNKDLDCYKILKDTSVKSLYSILVGVPNATTGVFEYKPLEGTRIEGLCHNYINEENALSIKFFDGEITRTPLEILISPKQSTIPTCLDIMVEEELEKNISVVRGIPNNLDTEFVKIEIPFKTPRGIIYIRFLTAVDIKETGTNILNNEYAIGSYYFVENNNPINLLGYKLKPFSGLSNMCIWKKLLLCFIESLFRERHLKLIEVINLATFSEAEYKRNCLCRIVNTISKCIRPNICKKNECTCSPYEKPVEICDTSFPDCPKPVVEVSCQPKQPTAITIHNSVALCALFGLMIENKETCERFEQCIESTLKIDVEFTAELTACVLRESIKCFEDQKCVEYEEICGDLDYNKWNYQDVVKCYGQNASEDCLQAISTFCPSKIQTTVCAPVTKPLPIKKKKAIKKETTKKKKTDECSSTSSESEIEDKDSEEGTSYVKYATYSVIGVAVVAIVIYSITFFI